MSAPGPVTRGELVAKPTYEEMELAVLDLAFNQEGCEYCREGHSDDYPVARFLARLGFSRTGPTREELRARFGFDPYDRRFGGPVNSSLRLSSFRP